jgi:hypothetical protein
MLGTMVFDNKVPSTSDIDMSNFHTGIYLIRVENRLGVFNGRVIKIE